MSRSLRAVTLAFAGVCFCSVPALAETQFSVYSGANWNFSSDVKLRGLSGLDLARVIRERWPRLPVCLLSGRPDRRRYPRYEADRGYLEKPSSVATILAEVERLIAGARRMST